MSAAFYRPLVYSELVIAELPKWEEGVSDATHPLEKLLPGPWRSLGCYLDYTDWPDRDRFAELDRSIAAERHADGRSHDEDPMGRRRRCRAKTRGPDNCNTWFYIDEHYKGWKCELHRQTVSDTPHSVPAPDNLPAREDHVDGDKSAAQRDGWLGEPAYWIRQPADSLIAAS